MPLTSPAPLWPPPRAVLFIGKDRAKEDTVLLGTVNICGYLLLGEGFGMLQYLLWWHPTRCGEAVKVFDHSSQSIVWAQSPWEVLEVRGHSRAMDCHSYQLENKPPHSPPAPGGIAGPTWCPKLMVYLHRWPRQQTAPGLLWERSSEHADQGHSVSLTKQGCSPWLW